MIIKVLVAIIMCIFLILMLIFTIWWDKFCTKERATDWIDWLDKKQKGLL